MDRDDDWGRVSDDGPRDLVEEPHHVMQNIVTPWLANGWCRRFVINLKFGHVDSLALLREIRADASPFVRHAVNLHIRHLYHDREEFTVTGVRAGTEPHR